MSLCDDDSSLWIGATTDYTVESGTELFSFGSGDYAKDSEGADVMSDTSETGRWIQYKFTDTAEQVILEKQRKIPEHLEGATFWNKVGLVVVLPSSKLISFNMIVIIQIKIFEYEHSRLIGTIV